VATLAANRGITLGASGGTISTPGTGTTPTISGPISGSGSLTIPMGGLDLKASNSFSGGLYITASPIDTGGNSLCSVRFDAEGSSGTGKIFVSPTTAFNCTLRNFNTLTNIIVPNAMELDLWTNTQTNAQIYLAGGSSATTNIFAITFSGNINGAASVNVGLDTAGGSSNPGGTVNFSGSNTLWTGGATLQAGTLGLGSSNCMGTGGLFLVPQGPAGVLLATTPLIGTNAPTNSIGINTSVSSLTFGGTNSLQLAGPVFLYGSSTLTTTNTASTILSGGISDSTPLSSDSLSIAGSGTLTLSGASTYDGGTMVTSGTLLVNNTTGSGTGTGAVSVSFGATFGGTGIISGTVDNFGTITPGNGPGMLSTADETWEPTSIYTWSINKAGGTAGANPGWSQANITGGLNINTSGSPITINLTSLTAGNTPGLVSDFNSGRNYTWSIAHTTAGITNFSTNYFTLNTAGFSNSLGSGSFSITTNATDVLLVFTTPVSAPTISSIQVAGTNLTINGSGGAPGGPYTVVTSTNVTLNLTNWVTVGSSNFNGSGNFSFSGATTTNKQQFYAIEVP
jgi:autotransporter-associated beta strand protein